MVTTTEPADKGLVSRPVVVDTSAWIEALRPDGSSRVRRLVDEAIEVGLAVVVDPVLAELAVGARSASERGLLSELLAVLPCLHVQPETWQAAAELGARARGEGLTVPLVDLVIAALAMAEDFELLHVDRHYVLLAEVVPLRQHWASEEIAPASRTSNS
jgi:Predicted nucleic acid-binding protein, contains PIN domain